MTTVSGDWATDERAARAAVEKLPPGYCILWTRDEHSRFCADLHAPSGLNLCGLAARAPADDGRDPERERVLRVLVESAHEHALPDSRPPGLS